MTQGAFSLGRGVVWRWALLAMWLVSAAVFFGRAVAGRFVRPLPSLGLVAVAVIIVVLAVVFRWLLRGSVASVMTVPHEARGWLAQGLPSLGAVLLAVGLTVAGAYPTGLVLLWVIVAAELVFGAAGPWTLWWLKRCMPDSAEERGTVVLEHPRGITPRNTLAEPVAPVPRSETLVQPVAPPVKDESLVDDELPWLWQESAALQELRYLTLPEQGMCVAGSQRAVLPPVQQTAVVHTVFHPPFSAAPEITVELQEPEEITIKAAQILPHGVRWELRAADASPQSREVRWAFSANCTQDSRG